MHYFLSFRYNHIFFISFFFRYARFSEVLTLILQVPDIFHSG